MRNYRKSRNFAQKPNCSSGEVIHCLVFTKPALIIRSCSIIVSTFSKSYLLAKITTGKAKKDEIKKEII